MSTLLRRRAMMAAQKKPLLPSEYQQVDYIARAKTINQYIATPQFSGYIVRALVDIEKTDAPNAGTIVVGRYTGHSVSSPFGCIEGFTANQGNFASTPSVGASQLLPRDVYTLTTTSTGLTGRAGLFGWVNGSWVAGFKAWGIKLYNNTDDLVFDGVPCYRKSDGMIGLFDLVSQTFCAAVGSSWTKGADV